MRLHISFRIAALLLFPFSCPCIAQPTNRVTILYDAFGESRDLRMDWGYSALIERDGKRILFDTGNNPEILAENVKRLGVDLKKLDFVVVSHRHTDHATGLDYVLKQNPSVTVYAPRELAGGFGDTVPKTFYRLTNLCPAACAILVVIRPKKLPLAVFGRAPNSSWWINQPKLRQAPI